MERTGRRPLQLWGFVCVALAFLVLGSGYDSPLRTSSGGAGFLLFYGLTYFFSNAGPNSTTFLIPTEAFPTRARALGHGLSAACGKVGATVGSIGLLALFSSYCGSQRDASGAANCTAAASPTAAQRAELDAGVRAVMFVCAGVAALGAVATFFFTAETGGVSLEEVDVVGGARARARRPGGGGGAPRRGRSGSRHPWRSRRCKPRCWHEQAAHACPDASPRGGPQCERLVTRARRRGRS